MEKIIQVDGLTKAYGIRKAVDGINLEVERGKLFALLGPNGAGKSTTINILSTSCCADEGLVSIDGLTLGRHNQEIRKRIGVVFQNGVLDDLLTIEENLNSRGSFYGLRGKLMQERINQITKMTGTYELLHRQYGKLSGGQRRRCDIARALLHHPSILFLDEPTTGLDPEMRTTVWETIRDIQKNTEMTILLTTHYMEEASIADNIVIMKQGKVAVSGTPDMLKRKFSSDRLVMISDCSGRLGQLLNSNRIPYIQMGNHFEIRIPSTLDTLPLLELCRGRFSDYEVTRGNMDDAYLSVIGGGCGNV